MKNNRNIMLNHFITIIVCLAGLLAVMAGCSDRLTEATVPRNSFPFTDFVIHDTTVYATGSSSFRQYTAMNGRVNLIGRSGGYEAKMLLQFYRSFFPNNDTVAVLSAKLKLRAVSWFGDSSATFGFTLHKILAEWNQNTVRWDSLLPAYEPAVRGQFSGPIAADTEQIVVSLDTAMAREWLRPNTFTQQYGVMLIATTGTNVVRGFHEFDFDSTGFYPTLEMITRSYGAGVMDTLKFNLGIDTFVGNNDNPVSAPSIVYTQSGVVYRSKLLFDVSFVPAGATVTSADLSLRQDPITSRLNKFKGDSVTVVHLSLSATSTSSFEGSGTLARRTGANTLSFDARHLTQSWVAGANNGLVLRNTNLSEFSTFDLFAFFNHSAPDSLRPKLHVIYAVEKARN